LLDGGAAGRAEVRLEVVGDDHLAVAERRGEDEADVAFEAGGRHGAVEPHPWPNAIERQCRDHGLVLAAIDRRGRVGTLAPGRPGVCRRVSQVAAGLIQEDQILAPDRGDLLAPGSPLRLVAFARPQGLFF
jgi:hypothetical protein